MQFRVFFKADFPLTVGWTINTENWEPFLTHLRDGLGLGRGTEVDDLASQ